MKIVIDIPEKEFGIDIDDKFQDFFKRLKAEIKANLAKHTALVCGAYELETIDMFLKAFNNGTPLPKGHGDLIDKGKFKKWIETQDGDKLMTEYYLEALDAQETIVGGSNDGNID